MFLFYLDLISECCIFHKKVEFGESEDESDWESVNLGRPRRGGAAAAAAAAAAATAEGGHAVGVGGDGCCPQHPAASKVKPPPKGVYPRGVTFDGDGDGDDDKDDDKNGEGEEDGAGAYGHAHGHSHGHGHGHGECGGHA